MKKAIALVLIALALMGTVKAIGVAQDYPSTFNMTSDSSATYQFRVQNQEEFPVGFKLEPIRDTHILKITPDWNEYYVGPGGKIPIDLVITIPKDARDDYKPTIRVVEIATDSENFIDMGIAIDMSINIHIDKPEPTPTATPTPTPEPEEDKSLPSYMTLLGVLFVWILLLVADYIFKNRGDRWRM